MDIDSVFSEAIAAADRNPESNVVFELDSFVTNAINALQFPSKADVEITDVQVILEPVQQRFGDDIGKLPQILADIAHRAECHKTDLIAYMSDIEAPLITAVKTQLHRKQRFLQKLMEIYPVEEQDSNPELPISYEGLDKRTLLGSMMGEIALDPSQLSIQRFDPDRLPEDFVPTSNIPLRSA